MPTCGKQRDIKHTMRPTKRNDLRSVRPEDLGLRANLAHAAAIYFAMPSTQSYYHLPYDNADIYNVKVLLWGQLKLN